MKHNHLRNNQSGLAAIIVTVILMLVISLITLSFASIARREQTQTLDRKLSSRAFYAAESGVNIAAEKIATDPTVYPNGKDSCGSDAIITQPDYEIDAAAQTEVTCLLIDRAPTTIEFQNISTDSKVFPVYTADSTPLQRLFINWQSSTPTSMPDFSGCPPTTQLPQSWPSASCSAPLLRIDLVPTGGSGLSTDGLANSTFTAFIFPGSSDQQPVYAANVGANQGITFTGICDNTPDVTSQPYYCQASITGLSQSSYFVRLQSFYGNANTILTAGPNSSTHKQLVGAQIMIDSTAKAVDVVRRIQVRKPLVQNVGVPDFALTAAAGICKRYYIIPNTPTVTTDFGNLTDPNNPCSIN